MDSMPRNTFDPVQHAKHLLNLCLTGKDEVNALWEQCAKDKNAWKPIKKQLKDKSDPGVTKDRKVRARARALRRQLEIYRGNYGFRAIQERRLQVVRMSSLMDNLSITVKGGRRASQSFTPDVIPVNLLEAARVLIPPAGKTEEHELITSLYTYVSSDESCWEAVAKALKVDADNSSYAQYCLLRGYLEAKRKNYGKTVKYYRQALASTIDIDGRKWVHEQLKKLSQEDLEYSDYFLSQITAGLKKSSSSYISRKLSSGDVPFSQRT